MQRVRAETAGQQRRLRVWLVVASTIAGLIVLAALAAVPDVPRSPGQRTELSGNWLSRLAHKSRETEATPNTAHTQGLSEADLYTRAGAAEDIVAAQDAQKAAAATFVAAVLDETKATRKLAIRAQFAPDTMASARETRAELATNEAAIKRLGQTVRDAGQVQMTASSVYVSEGQKRYTAVTALQSELAQEAQDEYNIKAAVVGNAADRFDPTSEDADAYNSAEPKMEKYHVARLAGVDADGSKSLCGRAEVKHEGEWGTVCFRGFTQSSAEMFCRTMGLTGGNARYNDGTKPTWDDTVLTHQDKSAQPGADIIWMNQVKCTGSETNLLECPFGESSADSKQDWKHYDNANSGCDTTSSVGLCCDVSQFCPPRSYWRPDVYKYPAQHEGLMYGDIMKPDQMVPEMVANCKCAAGFFMETTSVYSGKCATCMLNSCSSIGSTSLDHCTCLEGFYKDAAGENCLACPANSCSVRGVDANTGIDGCKCFAGFYMAGGACVMCSKAKTSKAGSTSADDCDMLCGLPDSSEAGDHSELVASAAEAVADATAAMRSAADEYVAACEYETEALDEMNAEIRYEPPLTLSKDAVAGYSADVTHLQTDVNVFSKYGSVIKTAGNRQVATTASYLAEGQNLKSAVTQLQGAFEDQMNTQHHIKEAITRCQPTVACVPSPCTQVEPSNPCEPWPSCYPHPCHPWPSCSTTLNTGGFPDVEAADPVTATSSTPSTQAKSPPGGTSSAPLLAASMAEATATTHKQRQASKKEIANVLQSYDAAAGFKAHPALHYFTADSSSEDTDSKEYAARREAAEKGILQTIEGKVNQEYSSSFLHSHASDADELRTDIAKGGSTPQMTLSSQTQHPAGASGGKMEEDSFSAMEKVMAGDKDSLFKTSIHPDSDDS